MMKIYIASAMFSREEKQRVNKVANLFRKLGHEVYVPHELKIPDAHLMPNKDWANAVFTADVKAIDECDVLYYFCEGMGGDIGAAWECGYAYAKGKKICVEELNEDEAISLMVGQCAFTDIISYQS